MEFIFQNKELLKLYETGKSRKYRLQNQILQKYFMRVQQLEASQNIYDLMTNSLNFERMKGYENRFSVRLQDKWRLEFEIDFIDENQTVGKVVILELSNHYR